MGSVSGNNNVYKPITTSITGNANNVAGTQRIQGSISGFGFGDTSANGYFNGVGNGNFQGYDGEFGYGGHAGGFKGNNGGIGGAGAQAGNLGSVYGNNNYIASFTSNIAGNANNVGGFQTISGSVNGFGSG